MNDMNDMNKISSIFLVLIETGDYYESWEAIAAFSRMKLAEEYISDHKQESQVFHDYQKSIDKFSRQIKKKYSGNTGLKEFIESEIKKFKIDKRRELGILDINRSVYPLNTVFKVEEVLFGG